MMAAMKGTLIGSGALECGPVAGAAAAQSWLARRVDVVVSQVAGSATGVMHLGELNQIPRDTGNRQLIRKIVGNAALVKAAGIPVGGAQ